MLKFALTLSAKGQDAGARQEIVAYLAKFGIEHTGGGMATLSFAASEEGFSAAFQTPRPKSNRLAGAVGASAPMHVPDIPVPDRLTGLVDYVSVTPPARHFDQNF